MHEKGIDLLPKVEAAFNKIPIHTLPCPLDLIDKLFHNKPLTETDRVGIAYALSGTFAQYQEQFGDLMTSLLLGHEGSEHAVRES